MDIRGKTALVTGAASGIGAATALALAEKGARLVLCDLNAERLEGIAARVGSACLLAETVDVADADAMKAFAERVHAKHGSVDIVVNNAGVGLAGGLLDTTLEDWRWVLGPNLWGVIHGCHFFVPPMVAAGRGGHVVNVASLLGFQGMPRVIGYVASKFAVFGLSESLRSELAPHGIGVTTICPGMIATDIINGGRIRTGTPDAAKGRISARFASKGAKPDVVARAIVRGIERNRGVVPVAPDAWTMWALRRISPALSQRLTAFVTRAAERRL